jgi:hypothetical protein
MGVPLFQRHSVRCPPLNWSQLSPARRKHPTRMTSHVENHSRPPDPYAMMSSTATPDFCAALLNEVCRRLLRSTASSVPFAALRIRPRASCFDMGEPDLNDGSVGLPDSPPQPPLNLFHDPVVARFWRRQAWLPPPRATTPSDSDRRRPPFSTMASGCRYFMGDDKDLYDESSNSTFQCRALNINEDLGQIRYVFSDKIETLHQLAGSITALVKIHVDTLL